ncbi:uncharacterized protein LOC124285191 [Haliotis rubra]|uniref:uncharacterized protein LOC124285191 n=1 Tax=Haliotis rubra TaxID=36100 RepID=UPI001EE51703|nr:uncharacterized protein LOC124285191 [Haliotis rubra]
MDTAPIEKYIMLEVECAPKVQDADRQTRTWSVQRGGTVLVSFTVLSNPLSSVIAWWRTGEDTSREILNEGDADHSLNETALGGNARYIAISHYNVTETGLYGVTLANGHEPNLTVTYTIRVDKAVVTNQSARVYMSFLICGCVVLVAALIAGVISVVKGVHGTKAPTRDYQNGHLQSLPVSVKADAVVYDEVDKRPAFTSLPRNGRLLRSPHRQTSDTGDYQSG